MCNSYRLHVPANQLAAPFHDVGGRSSFRRASPIWSRPTIALATGRPSSPWAPTGCSWR